MPMKKKTFSCIMMLMISIMTCMAQTMKSHTVQRGETLESIAKKYGVTVEAIKEANPNMGEFFYIGMGLKIPEKKSEVEKVEVVPAESVEAPLTETNTTESVITPENAIVNNSTEAVSPQTNEMQSPSESGDGLLSEATDWIFTLRPKDKIYGYHMGAQCGGKYTYLAGDAYMGDDVSSFSFGYGWGSKWRSGPLLLQASLYPYAGYYSYSYDNVEIKTDTNGRIKTNKKRKTKDEFTYGVQANMGIGIHVHTGKNYGGKTYLTVGYYMAAPKFETENMVKNGSWMVGITTDW